MVDKPNGENSRYSIGPLITKVIGVGLMIIVSVVGWTLNEKLNKIEAIGEAIVVLDRRLSLVEASKLTELTIKDASALREAIYEVKLDNQAEHAIIRSSLVTMSASLPKQYPPPETRLQMEIMEKRLDKLEEIIAAMPQVGTE